MADYPLPPQNGMVVSPYLPGMLDLRWDDPNVLVGNSGYTVVGVNIYRSDVSDRGPYFRVNEFPLGGLFYRDQTENIPIVKEAVDWNRSWLSKGDASNNKRWMFRSVYPIVKPFDAAPFQRATPANAPTDVTLYIDDVEVPVEAVFGPRGEITLINDPLLNVATQKYIDAVLPSASSEVTVSYHANRNHVRTGLGAKTYYRLATVVIDATTATGYTETPLGYSPALLSIEIERLDYIWKEAVRRNQWILQQGGERVKIFIRRTAGQPCSCGLEEKTLEFGGQFSKRCLACFGTGFVGGFEGPYDTIIAPDDADRRYSQGLRGRRLEHTYEVWTGPSPVLTQRDFLVKQTNERYSIGAVRRPTNRGNVLQQHFTMAYLDEADIRTKVPIDGVSAYTWPETRFGYNQMPRSSDAGGDTYEEVEGWEQEGGPYQVDATAEAPMSTEKSNIPDERQGRGRSPVWENQNH